MRNGSTHSGDVGKSGGPGAVAGNRSQADQDRGGGRFRNVPAGGVRGVDLVARAGKGGQAIETVLKLQPDLVLMDVHMPYLDGLTLAWFFARRFPSARVVLMSADRSPELQESCEMAGAFDFVHKENFREEFGTVLQRLCI
jgi:CheY-like chemotaxis protein